MALDPSSNPTFSGRITAPDADYPYGSSKNESSPGAADGTPYVKARADDVFGLQQGLLRSAGIVPTGGADTARQSQYMQAIIELVSGRAQLYDDSGSADSYVLDVQANQQAPASLFDGLTLLFEASATNTGASTVDLSTIGLGTVDIKVKGGAIDPDAGDIIAGRMTRITYRTSPTNHFELDRSGAVKRSVITASGAFTPRPDTKSLEITAVGGGGGGGGVNGQGSGTAASSSGGGGGAAEVKTVPSVSSSYTVAVGAGGSGGAAGNNNGSVGGDTTVVDDDTGTSVNMTAEGGDFGRGQLASSSFINAPGAAVSGASNSGGDLTIYGGGTNAGISFSGENAQTSAGGASALSGQTAGAGIDAAGAAAVGYGQGGAGSTVRGTTTNRAGGDGFQGIVLITEYL